ncbi:hypothetical protein T261_8372 [Streptomyces lydicus]|nr:hypothetical protein T261_8372 [Streptomyces lydicus]
MRFWRTAPQAAVLIQVAKAHRLLKASPETVEGEEAIRRDASRARTD